MGSDASGPVNKDKFTWEGDEIILYDKDGKCVHPLWLAGLTSEQIGAMTPAELGVMRPKEEG